MLDFDIFNVSMTVSIEVLLFSIMWILSIVQCLWTWTCTYINFPQPLTGLYAPGDGVTNVFGSFGFMWSVGATGSSLPKTKKSQLGKKI